MTRIRSIIRAARRPRPTNNEGWIKSCLFPDTVSRVAFIVPACQTGWEEMENLRGNFGKIEEIWEEIIQNEVSLLGSPTIKLTLSDRVPNMVYFRPWQRCICSHDPGHHRCYSTRPWRMVSSTYPSMEIVFNGSLCLTNTNIHRWLNILRKRLKAQLFAQNFFIVDLM